MKLFFSVGEPSGDLHGANLIRQLRKIDPTIECVGFGGPKMAEAGCRLHCDLTQLAVMWFLRVLLNIHKFIGLYRQADRYFQEHRPDGVVLIDYPGFNWWIASSAKRHGIPVFYYGAPQIWGWARWRIGKMRRLVDHILCKLPFEEDWYGRRGCRATFVGHPYFDETATRRLDEAFLRSEKEKSGALVTILPGSRSQEVTGNMHWFLRAAEQIDRRVNNVRFAVACFNQKQAETVAAMLDGKDIDIQVHVGRTPELIEAADCCMACSGSVSLELLAHGKPTVILYYISPLAMVVQGFFRRVKYITLVNLIWTSQPDTYDPRPFNPDATGAEPVPFPEYLTCGDKSRPIAAHIVRWLTDPVEKERRLTQLEELRGRFAHAGASEKAARYIVRELTGDRAQPKAA